jgi:hypothetical protein
LALTDNTSAMQHHQDHSRLIHSPRYPYKVIVAQNRIALCNGIVLLEQVMVKRMVRGKTFVLVIIVKRKVRKLCLSLLTEH